MHVEHFLQAVGGVCMQVALEGSHCFRVQKFVLFNKGLEFLLNVGQTVLSEFIMIQLDPGMDEMLEVAFFLGKQEQQCFSGRIEASACTADSVNVLLDVEGRVELDDPINCGNVQASCCHVSAQQDSLLQLAELVESG